MSCAASEPSRSARRTQRSPPASSDGGRGAFTASRGGRPARTSRTWRATSSATFCCASTVDPAMCGVSTVRGARRIAASAGSGSAGYTSSAAPAMRPASSASASASRSTISPRAQFTITAVGFSAARASRPMSPRVRSVSDAWREMTSASRNSTSSSTSSAPSARASPSVANGSWATMRISNAAARRATRLPTRPMPTRPRVLPCSSRPMSFPRVHSPRRTLASAVTTLRNRDRASASACSAAAVTLPVGALTTYTPRDVAAGTSMLSTPTPARPTIWSFGAASSSDAVTFVSLRTTSPSASASCVRSSSGPDGVRTSQRSRRRASPSAASGSATTTTVGMLLAAGRHRVGGLAPRGCPSCLRRRGARLTVRPEHGGDRLPRLDRLVEILEPLLERAEQRDDVLQGHETHVPDSCDLAFEPALAAGDDGVVVVTEDPDEIARVDPGGHAERRDAGRGVPLVGEDRQVERVQAAPRRVREISVPLQDRRLALLGHEPERFLERDEDADRRGGWRRALLELCLVRLEVEVRLRQVGAVVRLPGALAHRDHRDAGWRAPRLLRGGDEDVDAPLIDLELGTAGAGDAVDDEQAARLAHDLADLAERVQHTG